MKHELWKEKEGYVFCFAGSMGNQARSQMVAPVQLIWTVEANSHFEAMTMYWKFMNWGEYQVAFEEDEEPYSEDWKQTQK